MREVAIVGAGELGGLSAHALARANAANVVRLIDDNGRIAEGTILDSETAPNGDEIAYYFYTINGVDFESSDILNEAQKKNPIKYAPGAKVSIRFDPKNHGNSVLD